MFTAPLRKKWADHQPAWNIFLLIPSSWTAELAGLAGFDAVTIDMQHGLIGLDDLLPMLQGLQATPAVPLVRLPENDPAVIGKALDYGAAGLICPLIDTAEDTRRFVAATQYPPAGNRSIGPVRAAARFAGNYFAEGPADVLKFAMIETAEALKNVDAIAAVPGLSGLFIGPNDLSISMGLPGQADFSDPDLQRALASVLEACRNHRLFAAIFCSEPETARNLACKGFHLVSLSTENALLRHALHTQLEALRQTPRQ